jgi:CheY-like chemotaxis protein
MTGSDEPFPSASVPGVVESAASAVDGDAIALQRSTALARLAPGVAHDMRNHIGGLRAFASLLRAVPGLSDEDERLLNDLETSVDRASRVFEAFMLLAQDRAVSRRAVPLAAAVHGALALTAFPMMNVTRSVMLSPDLPEVAVSALRLHQALVAVTLSQLELLGAPAAEGSIRISARAIAGPERDLVELLIEDDAPLVLDGGEPPPDLAVARRLLELDGGSLHHEPGASGGNRFLLTLQVDSVDEVAQGPDAPSTPLPEATPASGEAPLLTVLVCDDEDAIRGLLARLLEREGLNAVTAASGAEALELVDRERIDVVLSDHRMPGMSGLELQGEIARRHPRLGQRFILMSGDPGDPDIAAFAAARGLVVLPKPFTPHLVLRDIVRDVVAR